MHRIDRDTCVFYYHLGLEAKAWAKTKNPILNTVWWVFEGKAYDDTIAPLLNYMNADRESMYWEVMCEAYTRACGGQTWVLIPTGEKDEPPLPSIWTSVEFATIKKQESGIVEVIRLDEKVQNGHTIWKKPETGTASQAGKPKTGTALQAGKLGRPPSPLGG